MAIGEALDTALWKLSQSPDDRLDGLDELCRILTALDATSAHSEWGALYQRLDKLCGALHKLLAGAVVDRYADGAPGHAIRLVGWLLGESELMSRVSAADKSGDAEERAKHQKMLECIRALIRLCSHGEWDTHAIGVLTEASSTGGGGALALLLAERTPLLEATSALLATRERPLMWKPCLALLSRLLAHDTVAMQHAAPAWLPDVAAFALKRTVEHQQLVLAAGREAAGKAAAGTTTAIADGSRGHAGRKRDVASGSGAGAAFLAPDETSRVNELGWRAGVLDLSLDLLESFLPLPLAVRTPALCEELWRRVVLNGDALDPPLLRRQSAECTEACTRLWGVCASVLGVYLGDADRTAELNRFLQLPSGSFAAKAADGTPDYAVRAATFAAWTRCARDLGASGCIWMHLHAASCAPDRPPPISSSLSPLSLSHTLVHPMCACERSLVRVWRPLLVEPDERAMSEKRVPRPSSPCSAHPPPRSRCCPRRLSTRLSTPRGRLSRGQASRSS